MYPRCDSPAEAAEAARTARFAPLGTRGFDGSGADAAFTALPGTEYLARSNRDTLLIVQLEHQSAVDQAEAIAAVPGVNMIMLGPADFSILEGFPLQFDHPQVLKALEAVAAAVHNTGKHWACTCSPNVAPRMLEMGSRLLFSNADIVMVKNGLEQMQSQFGALGFTFDDRFSRSAEYVAAT